MAATVTRNFGDLSQMQLTDPEVMRQVGLLARENIIRRTVAGQSASGGLFTPYSPGYAARKASELGAGPVNLTVSGSMLGHIVIVDVGPKHVTLGWLS